jgi:hypothetical protein
MAKREKKESFIGGKLLRKVNRRAKQNTDFYN